MITDTPTCRHLLSFVPRAVTPRDSYDARYQTLIRLRLPGVFGNPVDEMTPLAGAAAPSSHPPLAIVVYISIA